VATKNIVKIRRKSPGVPITEVKRKVTSPMTPQLIGNLLRKYMLSSEEILKR